MFYYLYKITNIVNGLIYVGVHRTNDLNDGYMGSGRLLKRAKQKYGMKSFTKDILQVFNSADEMYEAEAQIVNEEFVKDKNTYNTRTGGRGGPKDPTQTEYYRSGRHAESLINARRLARAKHQELKQQRIELYYQAPVVCVHCGQPLSYDKKRNKFCSKSCAASHNNKGRIATEEQKHKTSMTLKTKVSQVRYKVDISMGAMSVPSRG